MGSDKECFDKSGPKHISKIDWGNEGHRRCITACLVSATYILESDRTRQGTPGPGAAWWRSHLRLHTSLLCDDSCKCGFCKRETKPFIFGAIFEPVLPEGSSACRRLPSPAPPRFIVAFRGTKLRIRDIKDDLKILRNLQGKCARFRKARHHVEELLEATGSGSGDVWLAGHSLGASVALEVGRHLVIRGALTLPTFLFNPPHVSLEALATALRMSEVAKLDWCIVKCVVKGAAVHMAMSPHKKIMEDLFQKLGPWVPELYVHKDDIICQGYIYQFEQEEKMVTKCPGILQPLARLGMMHSFRDIMVAQSVRVWRNDTQGQGVDDDEEVPRVQPHLLPSVRLWKNSTNTTCPFQAHKLEHWWKPDGELNLSTKIYRYRA